MSLDPVRYISFFPSLSYLDRVWVKAFPRFFTNLRIKEYMDIYQEYRLSGKFASMSEHAFTVYRTMLCIKNALKRGLDTVFLTVDRCEEILRYGEKTFFDFDIEGSKVAIYGNVAEIFTLEQIKTVRFIPYISDMGIEKVIYYEKYPWLKIMIFPFVVKFRPMMVRLFVNPLVYARSVLKLDLSEYESGSENWIDPRLVDINTLRKIQLEYMNTIRGVAEKEFSVWFGSIEDLVVKVSQVEYVVDIPGVDKIALTNALRFVPGRTKTLKSGIDKYYTTFGSDVGLKYYITLKKGLQFKVYTKAVHKKSGENITRFEITMRVNKPVELVRYFEELNIPEVRENIDKVAFYMNDKESYEKIKKLLEEFMPRNCNRKELHYLLLFDLFVNGVVKGSSAFHNIIKIYKRRGIVKIEGRGVNTVYVLNPSLLPVHEKVREILKLPIKLIELPRVVEKSA